MRDVRKNYALLEKREQVSRSPKNRPKHLRTQKVIILPCNSPCICQIINHHIGHQAISHHQSILVLRVKMVNRLLAALESQIPKFSLHQSCLSCFRSQIPKSSLRGETQISKFLSLQQKNLAVAQLFCDTFLKFLSEQEQRNYFVCRLSFVALQKI